MPDRGKRGFRIGVTLVKKICVAQGEESRGGRIAGVAVRIGRHSRIRFRRAQRSQLLGHGPQLC